MTTIDSNEFYIWYEVVYKDHNDPKRCQPVIRHFSSDRDGAIAFFLDKITCDSNAQCRMRQVHKKNLIYSSYPIIS